MKAKLIKTIPGQEHLLALGKTYIVLNNNISDETPLVIVDDRKFQHFVSEEFYREHFQGFLTESASDMIFNIMSSQCFDTSDPAFFEDFADSINGIITESGGFACYSADDVKIDFEARS